MTDAIDKLHRAIEALNPRVDDDHPQLLKQKGALAKLLLQINEESSLQEAENLLLQLVPALQKRYGPQDKRTQKAIGDLVVLLKEHGKDAEEWRQQLNQMENATDSSAVLLSHEDLSGEDLEDWEGCEETTKLLRDLLGKPRRLGAGQIVKAVAFSDPSSSQAMPSQQSLDAAAAETFSVSASQLSHSVASEAGCGYTQSWESFDDASSSDAASLALLKAARDMKLKERAER